MQYMEIGQTGASSQAVTKVYPSPHTYASSDTDRLIQENSRHFGQRTQLNQVSQDPF